MPTSNLVEAILQTITPPGAGPDAADRLEPLTVATKWLPANRGERPPHVAKLHRYRDPGASRPGGGRVRMRQVRGPAGWYTCRRWLAEFLAELTQAHEGEYVAPT